MISIIMIIVREISNEHGQMLLKKVTDGSWESCK